MVFMFQNIISGLLSCIVFHNFNLFLLFDNIKLKGDEIISCFFKKINGFVTTYDLHRVNQNIGNLNR